MKTQIATWKNGVLAHWFKSEYENNELQQLFFLVDLNQLNWLDEWNANSENFVWGQISFSSSFFLSTKMNVKTREHLTLKWNEKKKSK